MDRAVVLTVLLLVGLTWLFYKLAVLLEPRVEKPKDLDTSTNSAAPSFGRSTQKLIHQRLRK